MQLSNRLATVASFIDKGSRIADIGTDHGFVPIYLIENNIAESAIAMDVRKGPLERASSHVQEAGLCDKITVRLSDGLEKLNPGEVDTIIIAGMGGPLITRILDDGKEVLKGINQMVLSPHSEVESVRRYVMEHGFTIDKEEMIEEEEKFYNVIRVHKGTDQYEKAMEYRYGKQLLESRHPVLLRFLTEEIRKYEELINNLELKCSKVIDKRIKELEEMLAMAKETKHQYYGAEDI